MLLTEAALAFLVIIIAFVRPSLGCRWFDKAERLLAPLANRRGLAVAIVGLLTLVLRIAVLPIEPIPQPSVHDEFAYLLQADTFAHGRLTNPTPAMWKHFETFHVIFQPTYTAKFFPGQGLFLALGQVLFGHPFWGVWLTSGLMCAAVTWMLQGWFAPEWAFLGGALAMLRFGVFGYWADSYWGGNVAAIGGALVLGALPRIKSWQRVRDALWMGLGLALLANSRPWEGLVLSLPVAVMLFAWMLRKDRPRFAVSLRRVVLPLTLMLGLTGACLLYYCWRTTGNPLRSPYQVYEQTYGIVPYMFWQHLRPEPVYRHAILSKMLVGQTLVAYHSYFSLSGPMLRVFSVWAFFLGPILTVPFMALFFVLPYGITWHQLTTRTRAFLTLALSCAVGASVAIYYNPHYSAPATCLMLAFVVLALRRVRDAKSSGLFLSRAVPFACIIAFGLRAGANPLHIPKSLFSTYYFHEFWEFKPTGWFPRPQIIAKLKTIPGKHLVIVHYSPEHMPFPDWVYNDADIDQSRIIWARDMGRMDNEKLLDYYKDRQAWLLEPDENPPRLARYAVQEVQSATK